MRKKCTTCWNIILLHIPWVRSRRRKTRIAKTHRILQCRLCSSSSIIGNKQTKNMLNSRALRPAVVLPFCFAVIILCVCNTADDDTHTTMLSQSLLISDACFTVRAPLTDSKITVCYWVSPTLLQNWSRSACCAHVVCRYCTPSQDSISLDILEPKRVSQRLSSVLLL